MRSVERIFQTFVQLQRLDSATGKTIIQKALLPFVAAARNRQMPKLGETFFVPDVIRHEDFTPVELLLYIGASVREAHEASS